MLNIINRFIEDESGATAIEYGLIVGLIAVAIMASVSSLGQAIATKFGGLATTLGTIDTTTGAIKTTPLPPTPPGSVN